VLSTTGILSDGVILLRIAISAHLMADAVESDLFDAVSGNVEA